MTRPGLLRGLSRRELWLYALILFLAVFTRFWLLGERVMSHDESLHTQFAYNLYRDGNFQHTPLMHGPILFHATAFFYFLFGDSDFNARIYTSLLGVAIVLMPALFRPWLGRNGALLASLMLLISPVTLYYHRYIRHDTPSIFFALLLLYAVLMYLNGPPQARRRQHWLLLLSLAMIGNLGSKETAFIYIAIFGSFLFLYWLLRLAQSRWQLSGRAAFDFLVLSLLLGGLAALGLVILFAVTPPEGALAAAGQAGWWTAVEMRVLVLGLVLLIGVLLVCLLWPMFRVFRRPRLRDLLIIGAVALLACGALLLVESISHKATPFREQVSDPQVPEEILPDAAPSIQQLPLILAWVLAALVLLLLLVGGRQGWWRRLQRYPELDLIVVIGSLILPWAAPLLIVLTGARATDYSPEGITRAALALAPLAAISLGVGLVWNWRRWIPCALLFYALFAFFFTTMFTNVNGLATGLVGSLGYWLEQQGVRRGSQPQYYYVGLLLPVYEFLPVAGSALAMTTGLGVFWRRRHQQLRLAPPEAGAGVLPPAATAPMQRLPFLWLLAWWAVLALFGYTIAGEKMPWLTTHLTLPLIFLSAWHFGRVPNGLDAGLLRRGSWPALLLLPLLAHTLFQVLQPLWAGGGVFAGLEQAQLARSGRWLGLLAINGIVLAGLYQLGQRHGWRHLRQLLAIAGFGLLAVLTLRAALRASFVNHDLATEYLVYAHAAPGVRTVLERLEETSRRVADGKGLVLVYDNLVSWPYSWYFRDFVNARYVGENPTPETLQDAQAVVVGSGNLGTFEPLLEDRFQRFDYIRMWWPMQDYFGMTAARLANFLDFTPANARSAAMRQAVFDIWWARDYRAYARETGRNFELAHWPVADRMVLFLRKDTAARIWDRGSGGGQVSNPLDDLPRNLCLDNWQNLSAHTIFGSAGSQPGQLLRPVGLAIGPEGQLAVSEEGNNRVSLFTREGDFLAHLPADTAAGGLERPGGLRFADDGRLYVADTWNYRVQVLSQAGAVDRGWGEPALFGLGASAQPPGGLWGPRDLALGADGRVYVADTGNKRVRVYSAEGGWTLDIGEGGSDAGQLDEPSGLALHPDGRLFIAEFWNRRISVFESDGTFRQQFPLRGWYADEGNRPYLALDVDRDLLYAGDPDSARVLVMDLNGNCLGSFGEPGGDNPTGSRIGTVAGLAVDARGDIWLADPASGRVLGYPAFPLVAGVEREALQGAAVSG
ncbi:MAG: TIGR03663 family protein [Anaerolineaceae bacterium]|nr:TIGR03663 family protein [Anaerolineaceae bacterium]